MASSPRRRDPKTVQAVALRMGKDFVAKLDALCEANTNSRREIVEKLVDEAHAELEIDPKARIVGL